ncbi:uncharacterized protein [Antedon mediterranea]|uniref:uncharacterized protein n=1 Tax=Antedon mediterranea TaxID=105859 RepID=UPI003AF6CD54
MATSADPNHRMLQCLRAAFPQIPDPFIRSVIAQNPNNYEACQLALQSYPASYRTTAIPNLRHNANGVHSHGHSPPQKHRYSEPNVTVHYERSISEASIHLDAKQRPVSAPPDKSTFMLQYPYTPPYVPYTYHNRSAPPQPRSCSTTASVYINQPERHSPVPMSDPRYVSNDGHYPYNVSSTLQTSDNTVISSLNYHRQSLPVTPTSSRSNAVLHHANTSPMLGRHYLGKQLKPLLISTPNDLFLGTPAPIKPMMSPASSLSSLTDSPELKPDMNQPPLPITKEQEEYAYTQALLLHQKMRSERLDKDYKEEKEFLEKLKQEVEEMERQLATKRAIKSAQCTAKTITKLSEDNRQLAIDIECMTREIELHKNQGKNQEGFYENIGYTGAPGPVQPGQPDPRAIVPQFKVPSVREGEDGYIIVMEPDEDQQWSCRLCTFLNHPALSKCETCDSPRD